MHTSKGFFSMRPGDTVTLTLKEGGEFEIKTPYGTATFPAAHEELVINRFEERHPELVGKAV